MKRHGFIAKAPWLLIAVLEGCASFTPPPSVLELLRQHQATATQSNQAIEVSIEDYSPAEKSQKAFDADLAPYGLLALFIQLSNRSSSTYRVDQKDVTVYVSGHALPQIAAIDVARQAASRDSTAKAAAWTLATGPFALALWAATISASASHTGYVNSSIESHFRNVELGNVMVKPGQAVAGFVFLGLPKGTQEIGSARVQVVTKNEATAAAENLDIILPTIRLPAPVTNPKFAPSEPGT